MTPALSFCLAPGRVEASGAWPPGPGSGCFPRGRGRRGQADLRRASARRGADAHPLCRERKRRARRTFAHTLCPRKYPEDLAPAKCLLTGSWVSLLELSGNFRSGFIPDRGISRVSVSGIPPSPSLWRTGKPNLHKLTHDCRPVAGCRGSPVQHASLIFIALISSRPSWSSTAG
jgi:hypothetical protein